MWNIAEIRTTPSLELFSELVELLQDAVKSGASIGFLAPLSTADARNYWMAALGEVARSERVILLARDGNLIIGCAQLVLTTRANAHHRAEIQKLIVHTQWQGKGLGRALLEAIEAAAGSKGRTLLLAEAREGGYGDRLFTRHGYTRVGSIPRYQRGSDGHYDSTVIFYRSVDTKAPAM
jgi:ribosomal protein S18 acetylase RimI-like enzyme